MAERVGIVGMGLMGQAFILNLRKADFAVQGFDVDPARMDDLKNQGGLPVGSPAEAAKGVKCVITSLPNSDIAREAVLGTNGIAEGAEAGLYICDTTTSRPEDSQRLAEDLASRGIHFLDSAVSGTSTMAREATLP
jgi:3-hydroxyisobutyrate dehydrogenase